MIPFSLLWGGFAFFWEYSAFTGNAPPFFLLFGGVFVLVGIYFILGRFIVDSFIRSKTYYGVTNNRIIFLTEFPSQKIKSLNLRTLSDITYTNKPDNTGTISFGPENSMGAMMNGMYWPGAGQYQSPKFELIKDVNNIYDIVLNAQKKAT